MESRQHNIYNMDLRNDYGFKHLLGEEAHKERMIEFLNAVLESEPKTERIIDIEYIHIEGFPDDSDVQRCVYDINCLTESGHNFIIELQRRPYANLNDRMIVYSACAVNWQLEKRRNRYKELLKNKKQIAGWPRSPEDIETEKTLKTESGSYELESVYIIALCDFIVDRRRPKIKLSEGKCDLDTHELIDDRQRFIYVQLPFFTKTSEECETALDRWLYFFKHLPTLKANPFTRDKELFDRLLADANTFNLPPEQQDAYWRTLDDYVVMVGVEEYARQEGREKGLAEGRERGLEEGREKGRAEGLAEGREKGLAEGRAEGMEKGIEAGKIEIAKSMLRDSTPINLIMKYTGLSLDVINSLK